MVKIGDVVTRHYADGTKRRLKIVGINNRGFYNQLEVVRINKSGKPQKKVYTMTEEELV